MPVSPDARRAPARPLQRLLEGLLRFALPCHSSSTCCVGGHVLQFVKRRPLRWRRLLTSEGVPFLQHFSATLHLSGSRKPGDTRPLLSRSGFTRGGRKRTIRGSTPARTAKKDWSDEARFD